MAETPQKPRKPRAKATTAGEAKAARKERQSVRFDGAMLEALATLAGSKNMSFANLVREACEVYLLKHSLAVELAAVEGRLAAAVVRSQNETAKVGEDVQLLIALFDQLARFLFIATPEVMDKEAAVATGTRRYDAFVAELHKSFRQRRKKSALSETIENREGANDDVSKQNPD